MDECLSEEKDDSTADDEAFVSSALKRFRESRDHQAKWRKEAREDYAFVSGDQWSEDDRSALADQLRPVITFNRIEPVIDSVAGLEVGNRQEVRFIPRTEGDEQVNEILTGASQWMRDQADAEDEESDMFRDAVICGMGWTETALEYDTDPDGTVTIDRIDPLEMYWDSAAKKRNLADARFLFRVKDIDKDEFKRLFPDKIDLVSTKSGGDGENEDIALRVVDPQDGYKPDNDDAAPAKKGEYRVIEYQWIEREPYHRVADEGKIKEFKPSEFEKLKERTDKLGMPLKAVRQNKAKIMRAFICGKILLEKGEAPCKDHFNYRCVTGKRDRNSNVWYGIVRAMKDPQRWANKWLSQVLHIINSNAKGGLLAEKSAFVNWRKAQEEWAQPDAITMLNDDALKNGRVKEKQALTYPSGLDKLMEFAISSIRDVSGVNVEMLGSREAGQAASLEYQRKQAAFTILASLFDGLRRYRKEQGRVLLYFITNYLSDGRLIRITGDQGAQYVPLAKNPETIKYDVIVDDAPTSPNQKEFVWASLQQLMPVLMKAPVPAQLWAELVKFSPLPSSASSKIADIITQPAPPDPALLAQQQQVEQEAKSREMDMQMKAQDHQFSMAQKAADMQMKQSEHQFRLAEMSVSHQNTMQKAEAENKKANGEQAQVDAVASLAASAQQLGEAAQLLAAASVAPKQIQITRGPDGLMQAATASPVLQ